MDNGLMKFIKNFFYVLISNLSTVIISTLVVLVVPKLLGIEEYSYWQLYIFYLGYVGFLHFGLNDGLYLKFGGLNFEKLDKNEVSSQVKNLIILQILLSAILILFANIFIHSSDKKFVFTFISISFVFINVRGLIMLVLQATNLMKKYAIINVIDKMIFIIVVIIVLIIGIRNYKIIILIDVLSKVVSLIVAVYFIRSKITTKLYIDIQSIKDSFHNISIGMKLMIANVTSLLIIGIVRFGIEQNWDIITFGKISLSFSVSNLILIFINSLGIILYPLLRRTDAKHYNEVYKHMRTLLMFVAFILIVVYYPLLIMIQMWLPQYSESLLYLGVLFPVAIFESKNALIVNTFYKTLRLEKKMLLVNMLSLVFSIFVTIITIVIYNDLDLVVMSILFIIIVKSTLSEIVLNRYMGLSFIYTILLEIIVVCVFMVINLLVDGHIVLILNIVLYIVYVIINKENIVKTIMFFKQFYNKK